MREVDSREGIKADHFAALNIDRTYDKPSICKVLQINNDPEPPSLYSQWYKGDYNDVWTVWRDNHNEGKQHIPSNFMGFWVKQWRHAKKRDKTKPQKRYKELKEDNRKAKRQGKEETIATKRQQNEEKLAYK